MHHAKECLPMKRFTWSLSQLLLIPLLLVLGALTMLPAVPTLAAGSGTWTLTGSLHVARADSTATLLANGQVLVVGGGGPSGELDHPPPNDAARQRPGARPRRLHHPTDHQHARQCGAVQSR